jgi:hypothetical protein
MMSGHLDMRPQGAGTTRMIDRLGTIQTTVNKVTVPENRFKMTGGTVRVFPAYPSVAQLVSVFSSTQSEQVFSNGNGPGSFQACPPNVADGGPDPVAQCANLPTGITNVVTTTQFFLTPNGAPDPTANGATSSTNMFTQTDVNEVPGLATGGGIGGRMQYSAGANQFGGTYQIFRKVQSLVSFCFNGGTRCSHQDRGGSIFWTPGKTCATSGGGGTAACSQGGWKQTRTPPRGVITTGAAFGTQGSIITPGNPKFTANGAPELGPQGPKNFAVGFPMTTGVIRMDDNVGTLNQAAPTAHFTAAGYDNRSGDGVIKVVGAAYVWGGTTGAVFPRSTSLYLKTGAASVAGPGILVALGILAGGYALRRRMGMKR